MKLKPTILLLGILCFFTGCINEYEVDCPDNTTSRQPYTISFIFTSIYANSTRAIEDPELAAENYENQIDFDRTAFFLFSNTGNVGENAFIAPLVPEGVISTSGFNISTWEVVAKISDADDQPLSLEVMQNDGFKIVCVANMKDIPTPAVGDKLSDYLKTLFYDYASPKPATDWYTYPFAGYDDADMLIPMYGVLTVDNVKTQAFYPNIRNFVGELDVLRAMSKIELMFTDNANKNLSIESASLNNHYNIGRVTPDGVLKNTKHDWTDTDAFGTQQPNHLLNRPVYLPATGLTKVENAAVPFHRYLNADGICRRAVVYVPEYDNQVQKDLQVTAKVSSGGISMKENTFDVCEYDDNGPIDNSHLPLARNYCITYKLNVDGKYLYVVQVGMEEWNTINGTHEIYNW